MADGLVALVGAGPGDVGLLTVRGAELLGRAEVVVYDRLAAPELLAHAPDSAERIYVGKSPGEQAITQDQINALLVERGQRGELVVRLKGGDPFVFGRGGEEALALARAGVPFEVVPGVTSAIAVPAFAGIPVTHRELASSFAVITGHEDPTKQRAEVDWASVARVDTLVVLMGYERLADIAVALQRVGRAGDEPAAVVAWGTTPRQRSVSGPLRDIAALAQAAALAAPAVLVVGDVVRLGGELAWFRRGPLAGMTVLVTRARDQASHLSRLLAARGAHAVEFPAIRIAPLADAEPLDRALRQLATFDWVVFTSVNGVDAVFRRIEALGLDARAFATTRLCAIGPATAAALSAHGLRADWLPAEFLTSAILTGFAAMDVRGRRFLLPRANIADPGLAHGLRQLGALVEDVHAYRTLPTGDGAPDLADLLGRGGVDVATFASSSTVRNLLEALGGRAELLTAVRTVCIGPVTAETARELGLRVDAVAKEHTIAGLVAAVEDLVAADGPAATSTRRQA